MYHIFENYDPIFLLLILNYKNIVFIKANEQPLLDFKKVKLILDILVQNQVP